MFILCLSILAAFILTNAQKLECASLPDGCDGGKSHETGVRAAIARFQDGKIYGGSEKILLSSAVQGNSLAMITYSCKDDSTPPRISGSAIRSKYTP